MSSPLTLIIVSDLLEDVNFAKTVAADLGARVEVALTKKKFNDLMHSTQNCTILYNLDRMIEAEGGGVESELATAIPQVLTSLRAWHRVIGISSYEFAQVVQSGKFSQHSKYLYRNFTPETVPVYSYVIQNLTMQNPFEIAVAGIDELQIQKTRIASSARKKSALEALSTILNRKTLPKRVSNAVVRATDELILNAIFDAPIDLKGRRYKHGLDRGSEYALNQLSKREEVEVELISAESFLQVSVTDFFGSLKREEMLPLLERYFSDAGVSSSDETQGVPGLGFYLTITTGFSIQIVIEPGKRTKASLLIPWVDNVRAMKDTFRFFCVKIK